MKRLDSLLLFTLVIAVICVVMYSWHNEASIDQETWAHINSEKSTSQQDLERREYVNLIFFQQTWIVLACFILPMILVLFKNRQLVKRLALRFEKFFDKLKRSQSKQKSFAERLVTTYSDISIYEVNLCEMLLQQMTSKEIANKLNVTPASVNTARYRLRKKLNIPSELNLVTFLRRL
ncbi:MAG: LuxR C-terminal-related transcriptional regulator [Bacteroidota bacterium]